MGDLIPYLSRQNVLGRDVYLTPIDDSRHYLVVDDMTPDSKAGLMDAGYRPALIQESSAGNRQAILIAPKATGPQEQRLANQLVGQLNRQFGDPAFSGVVHPFRMAGFSNKKPGRGNAFTRIVAAMGVMCQKAIEQLERLRARWRAAEESKRQETEKAVQPAPRPQPPVRRQEARPAATPAADPRAALFAAHDRFRTRQVGLVLEKGWPLDESRVDYRTALDMLSEGWGTADVAGALRDRSPGIDARHRDPGDYAERTVKRAHQERADRQAERGQAEERASEAPGSDFEI